MEDSYLPNLKNHFLGAQSIDFGKSGRSSAAVMATSTAISAAAATTTTTQHTDTPQ